MYYVTILLIISTISVSISCEDCKGDCSEEGLISYVDSLEGEGGVGRFLVLEKVQGRTSRKVQEGREDIVERCLRFLREHQVTVRIPEDEARGLETEGRARKRRRFLLPLLLLLKLKFGIVVPLILGLIGLVAFKGLGAGLVALAIAGAVGLKSLLEGHHTHSKFSYELLPQVAYPWGRTGSEGAGYQTIV